MIRSTLRKMLNRTLFFVFCFLFIALSACQNSSPVETATNTPEPVTIRFYSSPGGYGYELDVILAEQFTAETGIEVEVIIGPESATERLALYQEQLQEQSSDIDVYQINVIWPGILAEHFLDLNELAPEASQGHFAAIIENNTVNGRLIGLPFYTDAGILYYRTDLLTKYGYDAPPETWEELEEMAQVIQEGERATGNPDFWGYVWQGAAYEGLTCNALEWQVSTGGGEIINGQGEVTINNPDAIAMFDRAAQWIDTISPPSTTGYQEEDARSVWHSGNAAFMRNWPYAFALSQETDSAIRDNFAVTVLPGDEGLHAATLGGWQLAVSKYSEHPEEAVQFVTFMTSQESHRFRAIEGAFLPTYPDLYDDPDVLDANPHFADLKEVFTGGAIARPSTISGASYDRVSEAYFLAVHKVLTGNQTAETALADLEIELTQILQE